MDIRIWTQLWEIACGDTESGSAKIVIDDEEGCWDRVRLEWNDGSVSCLIWESAEWHFAGGHFLPAADRSGMYD